MKSIRKTYAGIGSRSTPESKQKIMTHLASILEKLGYHLNTGDADGADDAFKKGIKNSKNYTEFKPIGRIPDVAFEIAEQFHPAYDILSIYVKKLMARNSQIILGELCDEQVRFVVCWTPKGRQVGGTSQGMRIAKAYGIKVYNIYFKVELIELIEFIKEQLKVKKEEC